MKGHTVALKGIVHATRRSSSGWVGLQTLCGRIIEERLEGGTKIDRRWKAVDPPVTCQVCLRAIGKGN